MADGSKRRRSRDEPVSSPGVSEEARDEDVPPATADRRTATEEDSERALARILARVVPSLGVVSALLVGRFVGLPSAILILAGTALLGTIGFFWASLRTLSGDAPLPEGVSPTVPMTRIAAPERKRETLRALKDLELEHSVGKIDDADYQELETRYRETAKALMREMDQGLAPRRKKAEELIAVHLVKKKLGIDPRPEPDDEEAADKSVPPRLECDKCHVSNEPDAAFCKKCGSPLGKLEQKPGEARDVAS
jgi:rRNA maturation endonuclease Nob1